MDKYVKIPLKYYEILLKNAYIVNSLLEIYKSNKTNELEPKDLNFINFALKVYRNDYNDFKRGEKDG